MTLTENDKQEYYTYIELKRRLGILDNYNLKSYERVIEDLIDKNIPFRSSIGEGKSLTQYIEENSKATNLKKSYNNLNSIFGSNVIDDDIYIKCNPSDDRGNVITPEDNVINYDRVNNTNSIVDELSKGLNMDTRNPAGNLGMQIGIGIFLFLMVFNLGDYVFVKYPKKVINDA